MTELKVRQPEVIVFAGPNGSGKSTITGPQWVIEPYINADDLKREQHLTDLEAAELADRLRQEALERRASFTFETVLSTPRKLDFLREAKARGYFVRGYFILTRYVELNIVRVQSRAIHGLHDVPEDKIISRYYSSLANIPAFLELCNICHIYDNTAEAPFRICRKHKAEISFYESPFWTYDEVIRLVQSGECPVQP